LSTRVARPPGAQSTHIRNHRALIRREAARSVAPVMSADPRHSLGRRGEQLAAEHFERLGYQVIARNHRTRFGEIDLVLADLDTLVFCEVKTRRAGSGTPWDALDERKRKQVRSMGAAWLAEVHERPRTSQLRFDAVGVVLDAHGALVSLDHLEGAF
jgi:putative endonuclease